MAQQKSQNNKSNWLLDLLSKIFTNFIKSVFKKTVSDIFSKTTWKRLYKSKYEKWLFIILIPITIYYIIYPLDQKIDIPFWGYITAPLLYFILKSIYKTIKENILKNWYMGFYKMFDKKVCVVDIRTDKESKDKTYVIYSFLSKSKIDKQFDEIEHYFNTTITGIKQDKKNLKLMYIITNKFISRELDNLFSGKIENRLISILKYYNFKPILIGITENEFIQFVKIKCSTDINKVLAKSDDIAAKLKLKKEDLNIKVELDTFIFEIKKKFQKTYYFEEYLAAFNIKEIKKKYTIPIVLGINQNTGKLELADITKLLHILIAGAPGAGKSCELNCILQSSMYFGSLCLYAMIDFKKVELSQYKHFKHTLFINNHEDLLTLLKNINEVMEQRYELLESYGYKKIESYNLKKHDKDKIPYILLCIDEISDIALSGKKIADEINDLILRILNMGRASGILAIVATQRPSAEQLNTDVRDRLNSKISFRVDRVETQKMIGVQGTEKLKNGEFIIDSEQYSKKSFKALFIDEDNDKNKVYDNLNILLERKKANVVNLKKEI